MKKVKEIKLFVKLSILIILGLCFAFSGFMFLFNDNFTYADKKEVNFEIVPTESLTLEVSGENITQLPNEQVAIKPNREFTITVNQTPWYSNTIPSFEISNNAEILNISPNIQGKTIITVKAKENAEVDSIITFEVSTDSITEKTNVIVEKIPVETIEIYFDKSTIQAGTSFVPTIELLPLDTTVSLNEIQFEIVDGNDFAYVENGRIFVKDFNQIPSDEETFSVRAYLPGQNLVSINNLTFNIFRPTSTVEIYSDKTVAISRGTSGDEIEFSFTINGASSSKTPHYVIERGNEYVDGLIEIDGIYYLTDDILIIKSGITNKEAKIFVSAFIEDEIDEEILTTYSGTIEISVNIPVESISWKGIDSNKTMVQQQLSYDFLAVANPNYASNTLIEYSLNVNESIATIDKNGKLQINETAEIGTEIIITVSNVDVLPISKSLIIENVVATKIEFGNIMKNGEYFNPTIEKVCPNESLVFGAIWTPFNTTDKDYEVQIIGGSLGYSNLVTINGNTLTINSLSSMNNDNPYLTVRLKSIINGVTTTTTKTINIYVPAESVVFGLTTIDRGQTVNLNPIFNGHGFASNKTISYSGTKYNDNDGLGEYIIPNLSLFCEVTAKIYTSLNKLYISQNCHAGIQISYAYKCNEGNFQIHTMIVNTLNLSNFSVNFDPNGDYKSGETARRPINTNSPELEEGWSADLWIKYNNLSPLNYGLSPFYNISSNAYISKNSEQNDKLINTITARAGENGNNNNIMYHIEFSDGFLNNKHLTYIFSTNYTEQTTIENSSFITMYFPIKPIAIFNRNVETELNITNPRNEITNVSINHIDIYSSFCEITPKFYLRDGTGISIDETSGNLTVLSDSATRNPVIYVTFTKEYNGEEITVESNDMTYNLPIITFDKRLGSGGTDSIIAVNGRFSNITIPSRTGYIFEGYYTFYDEIILNNPDNSILMIYGANYYDTSGNLKVTHSDYTNTILYATWIKFNLTKILSPDDVADIGGSEAITINISSGVREYKITYSGKDGVNIGIDELANQNIGAGGVILTGSSFTLRLHKLADSITSQTTIYVTDVLTGAQRSVIVYYSTSGGCVASGTLITLADGTQKAVEDLDGTEMLLVWNLWTGQFDVAPITFIDSHGERVYDIIRLYFSDGTDVKVIYEHGFWDFDLNQYIWLNHNNANEFLGHYFNKQIFGENDELAWTRVQLINVVFEQEFTNSWSPVTYRHLCYYVNGLLSVPAKTEGLINIFQVDAETMQINQEQMSADVELYGLFTYADFEGVPNVMFDAFNGQYLKISIAKGLLTEEKLYELIMEYSKFFIS